MTTDTAVLVVVVMVLCGYASLKAPGARRFLLGCFLLPRLLIVAVVKTAAILLLPLGALVLLLTRLPAAVGVVVEEAPVPHVPRSRREAPRTDHANGARPSRDVLIAQARDRELLKERLRATREG